MKTQITKQHTNVVAVQPLTTFHKEGRMNKQSFTWLKLALFAAVLVTMAMPAMAASCDLNSCTGYINTLYAQQPGGDVYVNILGQGSGPSLCTLVSKVYFHLKVGTPGTPGSDEIYNLLLQAKVNGIPVNIRAANGSADCRILYVRTN